MRASVAVLGVGLLLGCNREEGVAPPTFPLRIEPVATTRLDGTLLGLTLLSADTACAVDPFLHRINCGDVQGSRWSFGERGEGPGEMELPMGLAPGPDGDLVLYDLGLRRLSRFTAEGTFVGSMPSSDRWTLLSRGRDSTALAMRAGFDAEIHLRTGEVLWQGRPDGTDVSCQTSPGFGQQKVLGAHLAGTGVLYLACFGQYLLWYPEGLEGRVIVIPSPTYEERFPEETAIQRRFENQARRARGGGWNPSLSIDDMRSQALPWYRWGGVDAAGRLWLPRGQELNEVHVDLYRLGHEPGFLETVVLKAPRQDLMVRGDHLLGVQSDASGLGINTLYWYDLARSDDR